ncbi:tetratricopeptide repeat protein [bacterium]|nr:tetratricopeptide repeat protein [bacterium]
MKNIRLNKKYSIHIHINSLLFIVGISAGPIQGQHFLFSDSLLNQIHSRNRNIETDREYYLKQLKRFPESESLHLKVAATYLMQSRFSEARIYYQEVLRMHPENMQASRLLSTTYEYEAKFDSALMIIAPLAMNQPDNNALQFKAADLAEQIFDYGKAEFFYKRWKNLDPKSPWPSSCLGQVFEKTGQSDSAMAAYLQAEENGGTTRSAYKLFIDARKHADTSLTRQFQEKALKRAVFEISISESMMQLSSEYGSTNPVPGTVEIKNVDELKKMLRSVVLNWFPSAASESLKTLILNLLESHPDAPLLLEQLALVYKNQKRWDRAIQVYERFLALNPRSMIGLKNLGSIYEEQEQWTKAFQIYQKGLNLDIKSPEFYPLVIRTADHTDQLEALSNRWARLVQAHQNNDLLKHNLIAVYYQLGQNDKAQALINNSNQ